MKELRACLAATVQFRWRTVSAVRITFPPFRKKKERVSCMGERNGTVAAKQALRDRGGEHNRGT